MEDRAPGKCCHYAATTWTDVLGTADWTSATGAISLATTLCSKRCIASQQQSPDSLPGGTTDHGSCEKNVSIVSWKALQNHHINITRRSISSSRTWNGAVITRDTNPIVHRSSRCRMQHYIQTILTEQEMNNTTTPFSPYVPGFTCTSQLGVCSL
jgi:hypothetical protein